MNAASFSQSNRDNQGRLLCCFEKKNKNSAATFISELITPRSDLDVSAYVINIKLQFRPIMNFSFTQISI